MRRPTAGNGGSGGARTRLEPLRKVSQILAKGLQTLVKTGVLASWHRWVPLARNRRFANKLCQDLSGNARTGRSPGRNPKGLKPAVWICPWISGRRCLGSCVLRHVNHWGRLGLRWRVCVKGFPRPRRPPWVTYTVDFRGRWVCGNYMKGLLSGSLMPSASRQRYSDSDFGSLTSSAGRR